MSAAPFESGASGSDRFSPYDDEGTNLIYNLLFADDIALFRAVGTDLDVEPWATLLGESPDARALLAIAVDDDAESRLRLLAFARLRAGGVSVPVGLVLGVVVEVGLDAGLDTLAVYSDGRLRYINQSGKMSIFDGAPPSFAPKISHLQAIAKAIVDRIGPWDGARLAPPERGMVRMSFLASDGLYFGQGPMDGMQRDAMAGPLIATAAALLGDIVDFAIESERGPR